MRKIYSILVLLLSALTFVSCGNESHIIYNIKLQDRSFSCTFDRQTLEILYTLTGDYYSPVSAFTDAEWVLGIDTSEQGVIKLDIAVNDGSERTTTLKIKAQNHLSTSVDITQIAAPVDTASHTLMFYFFGTSLNRYFKVNIDDAKWAVRSGILKGSNRILYLMQSNSYTAQICEICYDPINDECIDRVIEEINLDSTLITPEAIGDNIAKMVHYAEADRYGIVFAGHGQGWIPREVLNGSGGIAALSAGDIWQPAIGAEVTRAFGENNVQVNPDELAEAIAHSGVELDYILFDACFMANIEALYDLRNCANYIIASPCEIMGKGFPYQNTLPYLFAANGATSDVKGAAESYYHFYRDEYSYSARCGSVAVFKCDEIEALADATAEVVKSAKSSDEYDEKSLQTYEGQSPHQFYDFGEWINVVATDAQALAAFNDQLSRTVIAKYSLDVFYSAYGSYGTHPINLDVYSGVTTSAPSRAYPEYWMNTNWYNEVWQ